MHFRLAWLFYNYVCPSQTNHTCYNFTMHATPPTHSHVDQTLNFKINCEKGQYFITPKKGFKSVLQLVSHYQSHPIRSKKAGNSHILLLHPIPVDQAQEMVYKELMEQKGVTVCVCVCVWLHFFLKKTTKTKHVHTCKKRGYEN